MSNDESNQSTRQLWDQAAATFDNEPDHGLRDPRIRAAWNDLLFQWLPPAPQRILDIGCGTGSLSLLLAEQGHQVSGIDFSPQMITHAEAKAQAAGHPIAFQVMDAAAPHFAPQGFGVLLCRHLLWTLPEPHQVLKRWAALLAPGGRLILIEGFWKTGVGLHADEIIEMLPASLRHITLHSLNEQSELWGGVVNDERYALIADIEGTATA